MRKTKSFFFLFIFLCVTAIPPAFAGTSMVFEKLKALAGSWEGTFKWTGARTDEGVMNAMYYLTGNGSAVVENLMAEGRTIMTSVYHLDGDSLRMTHYCGVGNQPRLKAAAAQEEAKRIAFELIDITNLASPQAPHVEGFALDFKSEKEITLTFEFTGNGKKSTEYIQLRKVS